VFLSRMFPGTCTECSLECSFDDDDDDDEEDDGYTPVWPSGLWATSQGGTRYSHGMLL
jgi:hypothetical protein